VKREHEDLLRRLTLNDEAAIESLIGTAVGDPDIAELDAKTRALVRLAALIALDSAAASYQWSIASALAAGARDGEVVGVLVALAPIVGAVRVSAAAPEVALGIGCDLAALGGG
jgi:alkylhydroperoxidase/carboxymuconolactone decarboxylase family protein YurZ